ncbi:hypothetical protein BLOT_007230 [Blomia tropicalis]|nr:hypothetical protein BLOT_007230 [Blomia tropicalis]
MSSQQDVIHCLIRSSILLIEYIIQLESQLRIDHSSSYVHCTLIEKSNLPIYGYKPFLYYQQNSFDTQSVCLYGHLIMLSLSILKMQRKHSIRFCH